MSLSQRGVIAFLVVVFAAVSVQYGFKILDLRAGKQDRSAILRWREQILSLDGGENIYQRYTYPNPPIMAILLRPLAALPPTVGAFIWFFLKIGLAVLSLALTFRLVESASEPFPPWAKALTVLCALRPILGDLTHGNVNLMILVLLVGSLYAYHCGRDVLAGVILALAIACKVTPALFVGYFLWKRAWRVLAGTAVGLGLFFFVVPAIDLGWAKNLELLRSWVDQMVTPYVVGGVVTSERANQSLPGLLFRLLTVSPSATVYVNDGVVPSEYHNLLALDPSVVKWLVKAAMVGFVGLVVWCCRTPTKPRGGWRLAAEYSLIAVGMLLFSERTWKHHCVTLVLPMAVLCHRLAYDSARRVWLASMLIASEALIALTSNGLFSELTADLAQVYGAYVAAFVVVVVALVTELVANAPSRATRSGQIRAAA